MNKIAKSQKLDTYLGLCTEVYDLSKPTPPEDAYAFYKAYAKGAKGPILEPMCGTGRFLLPFLEEGFDIHGFDASDHMLRRLYEKAATKGLNPNVWHGFVESLEKPEKYDLIFIPSGSFCLMTDTFIAKKALQTFYNHLSKGGILLFEIEALQAVPEQNVWRGSVWPNEKGQKIILSQLATMQNDICTSLCKYELMEEGRIVHQEIEEIIVRIYKQTELEEMLESVGFTYIKALKAFDSQKQPSSHDESIVYECRK